MSHTVNYKTDTYKVEDGLIPGNSVAENPVEFDIAPAWGSDLSRVKAILYASIGVVSDQDWTRQVQDAVESSFENGAKCFVNTVTEIRGLSIPAAMAKRAGLLVPPNADRIPITTGEQFSRIAGAMTGIAFAVAMKITTLTGNQEVDARFFMQPSGSGQTGTRRRKTTTVGSARKGPRRRGTVASQAQTASPDPGTSPDRPSS